MIGLFLNTDVNLESSNAYYVIITIGSLNLVVPQTHVYALEPALDISYTGESFIGSIKVETTTCHVYALSEDLTLLNEIPQHRRICILLHTAISHEIDIQDFFVIPAIAQTMEQLPPNLFGLLCDQVVLMEWTNAIKVFSLPACMQTKNSKLKGLMLQNNEIFCVTTATDLMSCCTTSMDLEQKHL